jgi:hypothetical protein
MLRMLSTTSLRVVSDWGLRDMLKLTPEYSYIKFDCGRALRDISINILENAGYGSGTQLDLVYKQASMDADEYKKLVKMWGPPTRIIFCLREPSSYIASAIKKFPHSSLSHLQFLYIESFRTYEEIRGDIFEYSEQLSIQHYIKFLLPLQSAEYIKEEFSFAGNYEPEKVSEEMWVAYQEFKQKYSGKIFPDVDNINV